VLPSAPSITQQPSTRTVSQGGSAIFTVAAIGSAPLSYQWRFEGADLSGATQPTLSLAEITLSQAGYYTCVVRNTAGQAVSTPARLVVQGTFDQWRNQRFTAGELGDPAISGLTADPDQDGLSNLEEFFHGLEPKVIDGGAVGILPELAIQEGNPRYVTLTFRRSGAAILTAARLEASPSLLPNSWQEVPISGYVEEVTPDVLSGDSVIRWKLPMSPAETRKFLRLRLVP
jgi:hypothetical protein